MIRVVFCCDVHAEEALEALQRVVGIAHSVLARPDAMLVCQRVSFAKAVVTIVRRRPVPD